MNTDDVIKDYYDIEVQAFMERYKKWLEVSNTQTNSPCECGKEKFNFEWHTTWCPQYTDIMGGNG